MQDRYPAAKRGELQAAANLQDCFAGILAVLVITALELAAKQLGIDPLSGFRYQMLFIALTCFLATALIIRLLPADFLRVIGVTLIRAIYWIRVAHEDRLPKKGGVLLLPNHVTYADAFFISAACPRPVRFVMDEAFIEKPIIRVFTGIFDTMTIRRDRPLDAIREIIRALQQGDVVCLFPEGQLTRTGTLCVLQRGLRTDREKIGLPVDPHVVRRIMGLHFLVRAQLLLPQIPLSLETRHDPGLRPPDPAPTCESRSRPRRPAHRLRRSREPALPRPGLAHSPPARSPSGGGRLPPGRGSVRRRMWINGHQIAMINALQRHQPFHVLKHDPVLTTCPG